MADAFRGFILAMCTLLAWITTVAAQSHTILDEVNEAEQRYQRELFKAQAPAQKKFLAKLKKWRARLIADSKAELAKRVDTEIKALEKTLKTQDDLLGKRGKPKPSPSPAKPSPAEGDLQRAILSGGVRYLENRKRLAGFNSAQASAVVPIKGLTPNLTYTLELDYSSIENRRLQFQIGDKEFHPKIRSTESFDRPNSRSIGELVIKGEQLGIKVTMPVYRSKDSIHLHRLRLVPKPPKTSDLRGIFEE